MCTMDSVLYPIYQVWPRQHSNNIDTRYAALLGFGFNLNLLYFYKCSGNFDNQYCLVSWRWTTSWKSWRRWRKQHPHTRHSLNLIYKKITNNILLHLREKFDAKRWVLQYWTTTISLQYFTIKIKYLHYYWALLLWQLVGKFLELHFIAILKKLF